MITVKLPKGVYQYDPNTPLGRRGGFGQVFAGKTSDGTEVAVKKLHLSAHDAAHRELRIAEELRAKGFKHVIAFLDSGEDADSGGYFIVMPRAERSLQAFLGDAGPLTAERVTPILLQITQGLMEVPEIVHRDLKPDNVLYHEGMWKIADFGIAKFFEEATRSTTLKDFMTEDYAAPEQWRGETATHETDVYALGCIGFCLLTGHPPFTNNPGEQHQHSPVPEFECSDPRLRSLLNMMLRKMSATRPPFSRVAQLLQEIVKTPQTTFRSEAVSLLASVGADISKFEQAREARDLAERKLRKERDRLAQSAIVILARNLENLWGLVHANVASAIRASSSKGRFEVRLGQGTLLVELPEQDESMPQDAFPKSGWDMVTAIDITARQIDGTLWRADLVYGKPPAAEGYRWYEIFFFNPHSTALQGGFARPSRQDVDRALAWGNRPIIVSLGENAIRVVHGPTAIDDENEPRFHEHWIWLLAQAANGKLGFPADIPFSWPPRMLV